MSLINDSLARSKKDNKVTIFKTKDGPAVDVQINNETAWLNQNQMTDLFEKNSPGRRYHCVPEGILISR